MNYLLLLLLSLLSANAFATDSSLYNIYYSNRKAGGIEIYRGPNGNNKVHFAYNDRGRGPDQWFTIETDAQRRIQRLEQVGVEYMKDSVFITVFKKGDSYYRVTGRDTIAATFNSLNLFGLARSGLYEFFYPVVTDTATHGPASYMLDPVLERSFTSGKKRIKAILYNYRPRKTATNGLVWLTDQGRLLAEVSPWSDVIAAGLEPLRPELRRLHDSVMNDGLQRQTAALLTKSFDQSALYNCNYVDVVNGTLVTNKTIFISKGRIERITDTATAIPASYKRINASNKTVLPGLWDMHAHTFPGEGPTYLANGITSIRDLGNNLQLPQVQQAVEKGTLLHPRVAWMCGFIDFNDDMAGPCGIFINNVQEGIAAIRMYKRMGYKSIKLYSSIKPSFVKPLAAEAHRIGLKVHGHVPAYMNATEAITDGYDEVNHLNMLVLGFFGKTVDTRTRVRLTLMKERAFEASPHSPYADELIQLMVQRKTVLDPTSVLYGPIAKKVNMTASDSAEQKSTDSLFAWLKRLHKAGIRFVPGTDAAGGAGLITELKNYAMIGMTHADAIRSATWWSAQYAGLDQLVGTIEEGKLADLIIVSGNPLERLTALDNVQMVITNGRLMYTKDLRAAAATNSAAGGAHQHSD